jgi:hypothetical protein
MLIEFIFSLCFSVLYTIYWLLGMLGVQVSNEPL